MPLARTRISTSPAPATGSGRVPGTSTSGAPKLCRSMIFMVGSCCGPCGPQSVRSLLLLLLLSSLGRTVQQGLHGQLDAAFLVGLEHFYFDDLTVLEVVRDFLDALVGNLADVQQAVLARQQIDQGTEGQDLGDRAFVDLADFDFGGDLLDAALGLVGLGGLGGGDGDGAVFLDVDLAAGL